MLFHHAIKMCLIPGILFCAAVPCAYAESTDTATISVNITVQSFSEFSFKDESRQLQIDEEQSVASADFVGELRGNISVTLQSAVDGPDEGEALTWSAAFVVGDGTQDSLPADSGTIEVTFRLTVTRSSGGHRSFTLQTTGPIAGADAGIAIFEDDDNDEPLQAGQATITITPDDN
jgi:hypothetical protein